MNRNKHSSTFFFLGPPRTAGGSFQPSWGPAFRGKLLGANTAVTFLSSKNGKGVSVSFFELSSANSQNLKTFKQKCFREFMQQAPRSEAAKNVMLKKEFENWISPQKIYFHHLLVK